MARILGCQAKETPLKSAALLCETVMQTGLIFTLRGKRKGWDSNPRVLIVLSFRWLELTLDQLITRFDFVSDVPARESDLRSHDSSSTS
jgi:hypothetical protein